MIPEQIPLGDIPNINKMRAGEVWQPRPYPNRCSICGGLGYVYCKVPAPKMHQQAGTQLDAVTRCPGCKRDAPVEETKRRARK
jgi:hypothetical protein